MRLNVPGWKTRDDPAGTGGVARGAQLRLDLRRVVGVVVVDADAVGDAVQLEAPVHPAEAAPRVDDGAEVEAELGGHRQRRRGVERHVRADHRVDDDRPLPHGRPGHGERDRRRARADVADDDVAGGVEPVGDHPVTGVAGVRGDAAGAGVVGAGDQETARRDPLDEQANARWMPSRSPWFSRWSASTLVTTASSGRASRNDPSLSSASTTASSPAPTWALPPSASSAPRAHDGSTPHARAPAVSSAAVVVLPCVPVIATVRRSSKAAARAAARRSTCSPGRARAAASSGCAGGIAVEYTTVSAESRCSAECPSTTVAPAARSACSVGDSRCSQPLTEIPRSSRTRASALMPAPAIPMRCTRPSEASGGTTSVAALRTRAAPGAAQSAGRPAAASAVGRFTRHPRSRRCSRSRSRSRPPGAVARARGHRVANEVQDVAGQDDVGVPGAGPRRGGGHRGQPRRIGEQRHEDRRHPARGQRGVLDEQPPAGSDDRRGVEALFPVAVGVGHVHRRQPDCRQLRAGHRPAAAQREVGGGVGGRHPVDVGQHDVGRGAGGDLHRVLRSGDVQHLDPGGAQCRRGSGRGGVDRLGALRPAGHEQRRQVRLQPEPRPGGGTLGGAVQGGDRRAQRDPDGARVRQPDLRRGGEHVPGHPGGEPVADTRAGVGLVDDQRDPPPARRQVGGDGDVAAEADDDVGADPLEHRLRGAHRRPESSRRREQRASRPARQRDRRDELERVPAGGDERGVQTLRRAQCGQSGVGGQPSHRVSERQRRLDVSGRAAPGHDDAGAGGLPHRRAPARAERRAGRRAGGR